MLSRHKTQSGSQLGLAHAGRTSSEEIPLRPRLRRGLCPLFFLPPLPTRPASLGSRGGPIYVLRIFQETHGSQLIDLPLVNGGLERKIKVVQGLLDGETRHLDLLLIGPFPLGFGDRKSVV